MDPVTVVRLLLQRTFAALPELISSWGLHPECAVRYSLIREYMILQNRKAPSIISGYRSLSKQRCLLDNWTSGYPSNTACSMPISKPACRSRHTTTVAGVPAATAIDLSMNAPDLEYFSLLWKQMPYGVSGSEFGDPNHFHVNLPFPQPANICS